MQGTEKKNELAVSCSSQERAEVGTQPRVASGGCRHGAVAFRGHCRGAEQGRRVPPVPWCWRKQGTPARQGERSALSGEGACSSTGLSRKPEKRRNEKPRERVGAAGRERSIR